jgi:hypothetical protein
LDLIIFRILQGVKCKTFILSSSSGQDAKEQQGAADALMAGGGASNSGDEGHARDHESDEEDEGNL